MAAYEGYRRAYDVLGHTAEYKNIAELEKYAADPAKSDIVYELSTMSKGGLVRTGRSISSPVVQSVDIVQNPHSAVIVDCLDNSATDTVNKATGKSVLVPGLSRRAKVAARVVLYDDGRWLVQTVTVDKSATC